MMYAITIYGESGLYDALPEDKQGAVMQGHRDLQSALGARGPFVSVRLMPPATAVTIEPAPDRPAADDAPPLFVDGPYAETKESFLGFYAADFDSLDEALAHARMISSPIARLEVRPIAWAGGAISSE